MLGRKQHFMDGANHGQSPHNFSVEYSQGGHDHVQFTDTKNHNKALTEIASSGGHITKVNKEDDD